MNITTYLDSFAKRERIKVRKRISKLLEVSESAVKHWYHGVRSPAPVHALKIEKITNGLVTRYELRPDIYPAPDSTNK